MKKEETARNKKQWIAPQLVVHGKIDEITKGSFGGTPGDQTSIPS